MTGLDLTVPRDLGRILDDAFGVYRSAFATVLPIALAVVVPVDLIVLGLGLGQLTAHYDASPPEGVTTLQTALTFLVTTPLITAMLVHAVMDIAAGKRPSARTAIARGVESFAPLFWALILTGLAIFAGVFALIVGAIVVAVHLTVVSQAVVVEGRTGADALRRSWELVRGRGWWVFAVVFVTNLVIGVLGAAISVPLTLAAEAADAQALALLGTMIGHVLTLSFLALTGTLLYFTLVAYERGARPSTPGSGSTGVSAAEAAGSRGGVPEGWEPPAPGSRWEPPSPDEPADADRPTSPPGPGPAPPS